MNIMHILETSLSVLGAIAFIDIVNVRIKDIRKQYTLWKKREDIKRLKTNNPILAQIRKHHINQTTEKTSKSENRNDVINFLDLLNDNPEGVVDVICNIHNLQFVRFGFIGPDLVINDESFSKELLNIAMSNYDTRDKLISQLVSLYVNDENTEDSEFRSAIKALYLNNKLSNNLENKEEVKEKKVKI